MPFRHYPARPRHPHVIQFREVFLTQEHVCILMEYANGGSLFDLVRTQKRLKETQARWFFQQVGFMGMKGEEHAICPARAG